MRRVLLVAGLAVLAACSSDDGAGARCTLRPLTEVPETGGFERLDVHEEPVAVVTLDGAFDGLDSSVLDAFPMIEGLAIVPSREPNRLVVSAPDGELTEREMRAIFTWAHAVPDVDSIDGITCTEA